jgi:hypothetical protein
MIRIHRYEAEFKNTTVFLGYMQSNVAKELFLSCLVLDMKLFFCWQFRFTTLGEDNVHDDSFPKNLCLKVNNKVSQLSYKI